MSSMTLLATGIGYIVIAFIGIVVVSISLAFIISSLFLGASEIIKLFKKK